MRKIILMLAFIATTFAATAQDAGKRNAIKLNPLSLAFLTGNISYERAVSSKASVQLGVFYTGVSFGGLGYSGFGITPEFRYYFAGAKEALNGVYAAPFVRYQNFSLEDKNANTKTSFTTMGGGALIGWQKMWDSGFTLDLFAGPAYNSAKFKNESDTNMYDVKGGITGFGVRSGITIGFGF